MVRPPGGRGGAGPEMRTGITRAAAVGAATAGSLVALEAMVVVRELRVLPRNRDALLRGPRGTWVARTKYRAPGDDRGVINGAP
jgi:hypothetical protein